MNRGSNTHLRGLRVRASARACVSGGDCRFRNNVVEGKGRGGAYTARCGEGFSKRDVTVERKKPGGGGCACVVSSRRTCVDARAVHVYERARDARDVLEFHLPQLRERAERRGGERCYPGEKEDTKEDAMSTWLWKIAQVSHSGFSKSAETRRVYLNAVRRN